MDYARLTFSDLGVTGRASVIEPPSGSGVKEVHILLAPQCPGTLSDHLQRLENAYDHALADLGLERKTAVLHRLFASDLINQHVAIGHSTLAAASPLSLVEQPPLPHAKVALFAHHLVDPVHPLQWQVADDGVRQWYHGGRTHVLAVGLKDGNARDSYRQTLSVFSQLENQLRMRGMSLADHTLRTWIYIKNLDTDYEGVVRARREFFAERGLTADTHFIASTGIAGGAQDPTVHVTLDAYAVKGLMPGQIEYMEARDHLSPTHVYGVTFERGTAVTYGDRRHILLSGTASIDRHGRIVHEGDVLGQLDRTLENMSALLEPQSATLKDLTHALVYLRDASDYRMVHDAVEERIPDLPCLFLRAPVCRPGWLIELEATAVIPTQRTEFAPF